VAARYFDAGQDENISSDPKAVANEVIESFKELLDGDLREAIGEHHFHALHGMIREAIAKQSDAILERPEQNLERLKSEMIERRSLEL
jgi:uncharacterized protein YpuA (DUF1002 family)